MSEIGSIKSSAKTITHFANTVRDKILSSSEELSENPGSFTNLLFDIMGSMNEANFYEYMMITRELHKQTALQRRTLLSGLSESKLPGIFGSPAQMTFVVGFILNDLKSNAVAIPGIPGKKKLVLNKKMIMQMATYPTFTLDHNVNIIVSEESYGTESVYATFDMTDEIDNSLSSVVNPFIKSNIVSNDGKDYFIMFLPMKQFSRIEKTYELSSVDDLFTFRVPYIDNLIGFGVEYTAPDTDEVVILDGFLDGRPSSEGFNYTLRDLTDIDKEIVINFNRSPNTFNPKSGSTLNIRARTTLGTEGNFTIPDYENEVDGLKIQISQDRTDAYQDPLIALKPIISMIEGTSTGGAAEKGLEELRTIVMNQGNSVLIAPNQIENEAAKLGFVSEKIKDDIAIVYKLSTILTSGDNIIPTSMREIQVLLEDIPILQSTGAHIFSPKEIFKAVNNDVVEPSETDTPLAEYLEMYNDNVSNEFMIPFYLQMSTEDTISIKCVDLNIEETFDTRFLFYNENTLDKSNITNVSIYRNVMEDVKQDNGIYHGSYKITFDLITSSQVVENIKRHLADPETVDPILMTNLLFNTKYNEYISKTCTIVKAVNNVLSFEYYLYTDNGFDKYNRLSFINSCVQVIPRETFPDSIEFMDNFDMRINVLFQETDVVDRPYTSYDNILSDAQKNDKYYISTVYEIPEIKVFEDITDEINIVMDVKMTQPILSKYTEDVPDTYPTTVYDLDVDGNVQYETISYTTPGGLSVLKEVPIILHKAGDLVLDEEGNTVLKYAVGDVKRDANDIPIVEVEPKVITQIHGVPLFDRIYGGNNYMNVVKNFMNLVAKVDSIDVNLPDGCNSVIGLRNTIGAGTFKFHNQKTDEDENLNNLALSLNIGVKYTDVSNVDETYVQGLIKTFIISYISSNQTGTVSFNRMLKEAETSIPLIDYLELYSVNSYDPGICLTVFRDENISRSNDFLCIKSVVDELVSDVEEEMLYFVPDITITKIVK